MSISEGSEDREPGTGGKTQAEDTTRRQKGTGAPKGTAFEGGTSGLKSASFEPAGEASTADLAAQLQILQRDLASLTETIKTIGAEQIGEVAGTVRNAVDQAGRTMRWTAAEAKHRGEVAAEEFEAAIVRNPLTSVLVALGIGYLVGMVSRR